MDEDSLFMIQHNETCNPLVVKLPLDRFNRREGEDDLFTLKVALDELQAIVSKSNAATQRARHVTGRQDKISWWQERKELDIRMRNLVERIENDWLGACKVGSSVP
jgi:separase